MQKKTGVRNEDILTKMTSEVDWGSWEAKQQMNEDCSLLTEFYMNLNSVQETHAFL